MDLKLKYGREGMGQIVHMKRRIDDEIVQVYVQNVSLYNLNANNK